MKTIVVTRHPALVELLRERGIVPEGVEVISHATAEDVRDKNVIGVLPLSLAAEAETVTEIPLDLTQELRGKDLDIKTLREIAGEAVTYVVIRKGTKTMETKTMLKPKATHYQLTDHYDAISWVVMPTVKDRRLADFIRVLEAEDGRKTICATDGSRLHYYTYSVADFDGELPSEYDLTEGLYRVVLRKKDALSFQLSDAKYPEVEKLLAKEGENKKEMVFQSAKDANANMSRLLMEIYKSGYSEDKAINIAYLKDAYRGDTTVTFGFTTDGMLILEGEGTRAYIMPFFAESI